MRSPISRTPVTRRRFVQAGAALAATTLFLPRRVFGANERLNIACIGVTAQGKYDMDNVSKENIVALCDADEGRLAQAASEPYNADAKQFTDYRKMLDEMHNGIDAVVIATPDHHHAFATMAALKLGKHVYCEKPLTHSVLECRTVRETAAKMKVATQMGTQIHAGENYRRVVELIQGGAIGPVKRAHCWVGTSYHGGDRPKEGKPVPAGVDWDLWLGPAPERPYHDGLHPFSWRGWWDFGGGALADMACHFMDLPFWALELRQPETIESEGPPDHPDATPAWQIVNYQFPARGDKPPVHLTWYHGGKRPPEVAEGKLPEWGNGILFVGEKGMLLSDYEKHVLLPEADFKDFKKPEPTIPKSVGHHQEWINACKGQGTTLCNFDYSGALTEAVLLGNVAYRSGKKVQWDAANAKCVSAPEADKFLGREYRKGWAL